MEISNDLDLELIGDTKGCCYRHIECQRIQNKIIFVDSSEYKFSESFLKEYVRYLNKHTKYYDSYSCFKRGYYGKALSIMFNYIDPSIDIINTICIYKKSYSCLKILLDRNFYLGEEIFTKIINNKSYRNDLFSLMELFATHKNYKCTINHLYNVCEKGFFEIVKKIIFKNDFNLNIKCLELACKNNSMELINFFIKKGLYPNNKCLINICGTVNSKLILLILNHRIIPTNACIVSLFESSKTKNSYYYNTNSDYQKIINLLVDYGYNPSYDDVIYLITKKCKIKDIHRFNIALDSNMLETCYKYNYHPYKINVNPTINCLREECLKTNNIKSIKEIIKKCVEPDIKCLRNACKNKTNITAVQYLIEYGIKPDLECLKNISLFFNQNTTMVYLINELIKINNDKIDACTQYSTEDIKTKENILIITKYKEKNKEPIKINKKKEETNSLKIHKFKKKKIKYNIKDTIKNNENVKLFFNLKDEFISLLKLKELFIKYIIENKLINKKKKNYIKIDKKMKKILNIKGKNKYFQFENFDLFFYNFILNI